MEEERQSKESGCRSVYQGLPVTASALLLPVFYIVSELFSYAKTFIMQAALTIMAVAFVSIATKTAINELPERCLFSSYAP
ncbi:hypothetical protein C3B58_00295 [Lactonifactor longoviformis]|uniref:hypothetical protein n=1 Tax=Lactonifactor longoviformis TaxID=341220 RepID=UPI0009FC466B|nr:hypothetical protein [Lactonifactor longoviformis]POP34984.1 hypothetical protein C3B58_00295 [Lactonifactor longoviformis]